MGKNYDKIAKQKYGNTITYNEYLNKIKNKNKLELEDINQGLMDIFVSFGNILEEGPQSNEALKLTRNLQIYLNENYYTCSNDMLKELGNLYITEEFVKNIDSYSKPGTAQFVKESIDFYVNR